MEWLTIIRLAGKWIMTNWRLCATLAFACAVAAAFLYARAKWIEQGRAEERAKFDLIVRKGREEMIKRDLRNAAAQAKAFANGQAIGESRARDQRDNLAAKDRLIADLRSGNRRLQDRWASCVSRAQAGDAADLSGGPVRADELRREIAEQISEADDADSRHARLVEFVQAQQNFMKSVCPVIVSSR